MEKTLMLGKTEGKNRKGQQRMRWLDSITYSMDMNFSKLQEMVENRGAWSATVHGVSNSQQQQQQTFVKGSNNVLTKSLLVDLFHQTQEIKQEKHKRNSRRQE